MRTIRLLIVTTALGVFPGAVRAEEAYRVVKIWPEMPQGWHFYEPQAVAVDQSGNVYVGDSGNYCVKKFDPEGRFITEWGSPGQGDGQFNTIRVVMASKSGTVYVSDERQDEQAGPIRRLQEFTPYGQFLGQFERRAPDANKAGLTVDVAEDDQGNIFLLSVDFINKERRMQRAMIEKYSPNGKFLAQCLMEAGSGDGQLQIPYAIAVDGKGNIYVAEWFNNRVQKFDSSGKFLLKWGTPGEGDGRFTLPCGIAIDGLGDVYVRDASAVQKFTSDGKSLARWKTKGTGGIALDSHSNIYVACRALHKVLKLNSAGKTVAEWGSAYAENGRFVEPGSIAVDPSGHLVVADNWRCRIQRFTSAGQFVSKWGGRTWFGTSGLATDTSGNLYVACGDANEVQKYSGDQELIGRWGGSGDGQLRYAAAITVGPSGNVYVVDMFNNRVQKFSSDGRFLTKWGTEGTGDGQFSKPVFIAADDAGNVWVGDQLAGGTHRMQKFDSNGRFLTKWTKKIMTPRGMPLTGAVAVDSGGNSYYAFEDHLEKYDANGDSIRGYGQEKFADYKLGKVWGMCVDKAGCLYVAGPAAPYDISTMGNNVNASGCIRKFDADGRWAGTWTAEGAEGLGNGPIALDPTGNVYVSYVDGRPIWKLTPEGQPVAKFQIAAPRDAGFSELGGVAVDSSGGVYVVDSVDVEWGYGIPSIKKFGSDGDFITLWDVPEAAKGKFKYPVRIAVDGSGNMYITDQSTYCVHKLDAQGKYIKSWGEKGTGDGQFDTPEGIAVDGSGHVYVCDRQNCRIQKFDSEGRFLGKWGKEGSGDGEFHFPAAVAVGQDGNVFVADSDNHRVQMFTAEGRFLAQWGGFGEAPGQFNVPLGIAVDKAGNVYVSDSHNQRIQKFAPVASR